MKVFKLRIPDVAGRKWCAFGGINSGLIDELKQMDIGDTVEIECVEMSDEEYKNLPDFDGF